MLKLLELFSIFVMFLRMKLSMKVESKVAQSPNFLATTLT
jgi:hypothetical protein